MLFVVSIDMTIVSIGIQSMCGGEFFLAWRVASGMFKGMPSDFAFAKKSSMVIVGSGQASAGICPGLSVAVAVTSAVGTAATVASSVVMVEAVGSGIWSVECEMDAGGKKGRKN